MGYCQAQEGYGAQYSSVYGRNQIYSPPKSPTFHYGIATRVDLLPFSCRLSRESKMKLFQQLEQREKLSRPSALELQDSKMNERSKAKN